MVALPSITGWIACGAAAVAVGAVAVGSLVLRETSRQQLTGAPAAAVAQSRAATPPAPLLRLDSVPKLPAGAAAATVKHAAAASPVVADPEKPGLAFDVVRVEPGGSAVVAGHGAAKTKVSLLDGNRVVDTVVSDASGQFVFVPPPLSPGAHLLHLAAAGGPPGRSMRVDVPPVTGKPAALAPPSVAGAAIVAVPPSALEFRTLEIEPTGAFVVTGSGEAGHVLRIYLNGSFLAAVKPEANGSWSLRVEKGMDPGGYQVRADDVRASDEVIVASAGTSFQYAGGDAVAAEPSLPDAAPDRPVVAALPPPSVGEVSPPVADTRRSTAPAPAAIAKEPATGAPVAAADPPPQSVSPRTAPRETAPASTTPDAVGGRLPPPLAATTSSVPTTKAIAAPPPVERSGVPRSVSSAGVAPRRSPKAKVIALPTRRLPVAGSPAVASGRNRVGTGPVAAAAAATLPRAASYRATPVQRPVRVSYKDPSIRYGRSRVVARVPLFRPPSRTALGGWRAIWRPPALPAPVWAVPAHAVIAQVRTIVVRPGDTLRTITARAYGSTSGADVARLLRGNPTRVRYYPLRLIAGQTLVLPPAAAAMGFPRR